MNLKFEIIFITDSTKEILSALAQVICKPEWRVVTDGKESKAIEDAGIHMCLNKLALLDKGKEDGTLGEAIAEYLGDEAVNTK